jgi:hypothetical protein
MCGGERKIRLFFTGAIVGEKKLRHWQMIAMLDFLHISNMSHKHKKGSLIALTKR